MSSPYLGRYGKGFLKMQKITTTLFVASVFALMACSKDDKNYGPAQITVNPTVDVNAIKDSFVSEGKYEDIIGSGKMKHEDVFNFGCGKENREIDSQTKVGDRSVVRMIQANQDMQLEILRASTILSASDDLTEEMQEYLSINVSNPSLGEVLSQKFSTKETCVTTHDEKGSNTDCKSDDEENSLKNLTSAGQSFFNSFKEKQQTHCELQSSEENIEYVKEIGAYTFASGKTVKALRSTSKAKGTVICKRGNMSQEMGSGEQTFTEIRSNEVLPGLDRYFCGGGEIKTALTIKLDGKAIQSFLIEKIAPTFRN